MQRLERTACERRGLTMPWMARGVHAKIYRRWNGSNVTKQKKKSGLYLRLEHKQATLSVKCENKPWSRWNNLGTYLKRRPGYYSTATQPTRPVFKQLTDKSNSASIRRGGTNIFQGPSLEELCMTPKLSTWQQLYAPNITQTLNMINPTRMTTLMELRATIRDTGAPNTFWGVCLTMVGDLYNSIGILRHYPHNGWGALYYCWYNEALTSYLLSSILLVS